MLNSVDIFKNPREKIIGESNSIFDDNVMKQKSSSIYVTR